jgi:hypothetical protein
MAQGAGGSSGGIGQFFLGLVMMCGGFYLLLSNVIVTSTFGMGSRLFGLGGFGITGGIIMVPLVLGIGMIFYNARNYLGWLITIASFFAMVFGVISSVNLDLRTMSAFYLITVLVLAFGGLGLFLNSLRSAAAAEQALR